VNNSHQPSPAVLADELDQLVKAGRRGDAVERFQIKGVGIPEEVVVHMRNAPFRPMLEKTAHTLVYEMRILAEATSQPEFIASLHTPTLIMAGGNSPTFLQSAAQSLAAVLPNGQCRILEGQTHDIVPDAVAPLVSEFLMAESVQ
jgi:pimeloyl-ACP methyl ester carboxylesterase